MVQKCLIFFTLWLCNLLRFVVEVPSLRSSQYSNWSLKPAWKYWISYKSISFTVDGCVGQGDDNGGWYIEGTLTDENGGKCDIEFYYSKRFYSKSICSVLSLINNTDRLSLCYFCTRCTTDYLSCCWLMFFIRTRLIFKVEMSVVQNVYH